METSSIGKNNETGKSHPHSSAPPPPPPPRGKRRQIVREHKSESESGAGAGSVAGPDSYTDPPGLSPYIHTLAIAAPKTKWGSGVVGVVELIIYAMEQFKVNAQLSRLGAHQPASVPDSEMYTISGVGIGGEQVGRLIPSTRNISCVTNTYIRACQQYVLCTRNMDHRGYCFDVFVMRNLLRIYHFLRPCVVTLHRGGVYIQNGVALRDFVCHIHSDHVYVKGILDTMDPTDTYQPCTSTDGRADIFVSLHTAMDYLAIHDIVCKWGVGVKCGVVSVVTARIDILASTTYTSDTPGSQHLWDIRVALLEEVKPLLSRKAFLLYADRLGVFVLALSDECDRFCDVMGTPGRVMPLDLLARLVETQSFFDPYHSKCVTCIGSIRRLILDSVHSHRLQSSPGIPPEIQEMVKTYIDDHAPVNVGVLQLLNMVRMTIDSHWLVPIAYRSRVDVVSIIAGGLPPPESLTYTAISMILKVAPSLIVVDNEVTPRADSIYNEMVAFVDLVTGFERITHQRAPVICGVESSEELMEREAWAYFDALPRHPQPLPYTGDVEGMGGIEVVKQNTKYMLHIIFNVYHFLECGLLFHALKNRRARTISVDPKTKITYYYHFTLSSLEEYFTGVTTGLDIQSGALATDYHESVVQLITAKIFVSLGLSEISVLTMD